MNLKIISFIQAVMLIQMMAFSGCAFPRLKGEASSPQVDSGYDSSSHLSHEMRESEGLSESPASAESTGKVRQDEASHDQSISTLDQSVLDPQVRRSYLSRGRVTRDDFIDSAPEEGSLWASNGQTNYFFTKNKVRTPGDLITLLIENDIYKEIGLEIKRSLNLHEQTTELSQLSSAFKQKSLQDLYKRMPQLEVKPDSKDKGSNVSSTPVIAQEEKSDHKEVESDYRKDPFFQISKQIQNSIKTTQSVEDVNRLVNQISLKDINIFPSLELQPGDSMAGQILERSPSGHYKIRTIKRVFYKNGKSRFIKIIGTIKGSEMSEDTDIINSGKLYEYRVEVAQ